MAAAPARDDGAGASRERGASRSEGGALVGRAADARSSSGAERGCDGGGAAGGITGTGAPARRGGRGVSISWASPSPAGAPERGGGTEL